MQTRFISFFSSFVSEFFASARRDHVLRRGDVQRVIVRQVMFTGQHAFRLVALVAVFVGILTVAQSAAQLQRWGGQQALGSLLMGAIFRELGPLLVSLIVISRSVSAVASELSSMKANGEIDMLKASGISPISYLVFPRVVGGTFSLLLLMMHFVWIAWLTGFFSAQIFVTLAWSKFLGDLLQALTGMDILIFLLKCLGTGFGVFALACFNGLRTSGKSFEVPVATTQAVVSSFLFTLCWQVALSLVYYLVMFPWVFEVIL